MGYPNIIQDITNLNSKHDIELSNLNIELSNKIETQINDVKETYLPLSGGTMNGNISFSNGNRIVQTDNDEWNTLDLWTSGIGASLHLRSFISPTSPSTFALSAKDDSGNNSVLYGTAVGNLYWRDVNVSCITYWKSGYNWYKKYSNGCLEQGGIADYGSLTIDNARLWVTFPISFIDNVYTIIGNTIRLDMDGAGNGLSSCDTSFFNLTTTGCYIRWYYSGGSEKARYAFWVAYGKWK